MSIGTTFGVHTLRVTEIQGATTGDTALLGDTIVRSGFSVTLTPVIEPGKTHRDPREGNYVFALYKSPDTFQYFEFSLTPTGPLRWLRVLDRRFTRLLKGHCAVEFWTQYVGDEQWPWVHWVFPSTSWKKTGLVSYEGRSHPEGPTIETDDYPEPGLSISDGGFWKTAEPPPT